MIKEIKNYRRFYKLYIDYQNELMKITGDEWKIQSLYEIVTITVSVEGCHDAYIIHEGRIAGIVCYQRVDDILYINQFYIVPKYRRNKVGYKTIKSMLELELGKGYLMLHILKKNKPAMKFWDYVAKECNLIKCEDSRLRKEDDCYEFTYRRA